MLGLQANACRAALKSDFLLRLDDRVLYLIANSADPKVAEAQALYQRFQNHDFYKCAVDQPLDIQSDRFLHRLDDNDQILQEESLRDEKVWDMTTKQIQDGLLGEKDFFPEAFSTPHPPASYHYQLLVSSLASRRSFFGSSPSFSSLYC